MSDFIPTSIMAIELQLIIIHNQTHSRKSVWTAQERPCRWCCVGFFEDTYFFNSHFIWRFGSRTLVSIHNTGPFYLKSNLPYIACHDTSRTGLCQNMCDRMPIADSRCWRQYQCWMMGALKFKPNQACKCQGLRYITMKFDLVWSDPIS